jgi:hypothetical protein
MPRKYKLTGCAKFFIFFIIAAPLAYIGASYYNGQNPFQQVREFIQSFVPVNGSSEDTTEVTMDQNVNAAPPQTAQENGSVFQEMELKELEIKSLKNDLKDCETLKNKQSELIETQKLEIRNLKQQLEASK